MNGLRQDYQGFEELGGPCYAWDDGSTSHVQGPSRKYPLEAKHKNLMFEVMSWAIWKLGDSYFCGLINVEMVQ